MLLRTMAIAIVAIALTASAGLAHGADFHEKLPVLEARWEHARKALDLPGFAVAIATSDGIVYSKGFGLRSLESETPFTPGTSTYIASVTKVFVTLAIMQLSEAGQLDLDAPVKTYLPRFTLSDKQLAATITIRDLLCHRYGVNCSPIVFRDAYTGQIDDDVYYALLAQSEIAGEWSYTNVHFTILGRVIEAVSGESWKDYLANYVFRPLGMTHTTAYASELYGYPESATPLEYNEDRWMEAPIRKIDSTMHAAGGLGASAEDLGRWIALHLNGGEFDGVRLVSHASIDAILTKETEPKTSFFRFGRPEMGLGWYRGIYNRELLAHHFGSYVGAHAHVSFMPEHDIGVAVVANTNTAATLMIHQIAAHVYDAALDDDGKDPWPYYIDRTQREIAESREGAAERRSALDAQPGPLDLSLPMERYTGVYSNERWGTMEVTLHEGVLAAAIGNVPFSLTRAARDRAMADSYMGRREFVFDTDGGAVAAIRIPDFWGEAMVFTREN